MPIEINYDFKGPQEDGPSDQKDVRTNLHITRCCANCKFYVTKGKESNRGYCRYPNPSSKNLYKKGGEKWDVEELKKTWAKAHATMLCDLYQVRGRTVAIKQIEQWLGKEILNDGTLKE